MQSAAEYVAQRPFVFLGEFLKEAACPGVIGDIGSGSDERERRPEARNPFGKAAKFHRVFISGKVSATAPAFIADAPVANVERVLVSALRPQVRHGGGSRRRITVFKPLVEIEGSQSSEVGREIRLGPDQLTKPRELVGAEFIGLVLLRAVRGFAQIRRISPEVSAPGSLVPRSDTIAPVVAIGKTTARPANYRGVQKFQAIDERFADAADVRNLRFLSDPDAVVDTAAQMFREMAVNVRRNGSDGLLGEYFDSCGGSPRETGRGHQGEAGEYEIATVHRVNDNAYIAVIPVYFRFSPNRARDIVKANLGVRLTVNCCAVLIAAVGVAAPLSLRCENRSFAVAALSHWSAVFSCLQSHARKQVVPPPQKEFAVERVETLKRAAALIAGHDLTSAEETLERFLKTASDDPVALNLLGVVRMQQQKTDQAEKLFRRALSINQKIAGPHVNLALLYSGSRPLDSIGELKEALAVAPKDEQARSLLYRVTKQSSLGALRSGNKEQALAILLRARDVLPHDPELLYEFAMVAKDTGLRKDAQAALEEALRVRPGYQEARYALARVYLDENMAKMAEQEMRKYLAVKPDDATAQYGLGFILVAEEKVDEARAAFEKSLALEPNQTESVFELGRIAAQKGDDLSAGEDFKKVLSRDPHHAGALTELGSMEYRAADYGKAKNDLEQAIAAAPGFQKAHYFYALTLAKLGQKEEAGRQFAISRSLQKAHTDAPRLADARP